MSGKCLEIFWKMSGKYPDRKCRKKSRKCPLNVWKMRKYQKIIRKCPEYFRKMSGKCAENVRKIFGKCTENLQKMAGKIPENVLKMYGKCLGNNQKMGGKYPISQLFDHGNGSYFCVLKLIIISFSHPYRDLLHILLSCSYVYACLYTIGPHQQNLALGRAFGAPTSFVARPCV